MNDYKDYDITVLRFKYLYNITDALNVPSFDYIIKNVNKKFFAIHSLFYPIYEINSRRFIIPKRWYKVHNNELRLYNKQAATVFYFQNGTFEGGFSDEMFDGIIYLSDYPFSDIFLETFHASLLCNTNDATRIQVINFFGKTELFLCVSQFKETMLIPVQQSEWIEFDTLENDFFVLNTSSFITGTISDFLNKVSIVDTSTRNIKELSLHKSFILDGMYLDNSFTDGSLISISL